VVVCFIFRALTLKRLFLCRVDSVSKALIVSVLYLCGTVLLLVPTRELALQTSQVCKELAKHLNIQIMVTTGGTGLRDDIMRLYQPVHLLVGTPGRVLDLANKGVCNLRECAMLVMDEVRAGLFIAQSLGL
jgi:superfamily II DNA/RNA helicase